MLIGFTAIAGAGKDTAALGIKNADIRAFAGPLKDSVKILFCLTDEQLYDNKHKEIVDERWNKSPRQLLQETGSLMRSIDKDIFVKNMQYKINENKKNKNRLVVTDIRYDNEAELIKSNGGIIIKIMRPGAVTTIHNKHETEKGISEHLVDHIVINDGTIEDLHIKIKSLLFLYTPKN
jgi:hypothetical protein